MKFKLSLGAVNAVNFEGVFPMRVSNFLSSPAVLPLKILHNDQTHILLIFYWIIVTKHTFWYVNSEQKWSRRFFVQNIQPEMF